MEKTKRSQKYRLFSLNPMVFYPFFLFLFFVCVLFAGALLVKREGKTSFGFAHLLGIRTLKDLFILLLVILSLIFVLMVLIYSLGFLPPSPPLPA